MANEVRSLARKIGGYLTVGEVELLLDVLDDGRVDAFRDTVSEQFLELYPQRAQKYFGPAPKHKGRSM